MKLLIVEDEKALADVLEEKFKKEKYKVFVAYDGEAATASVKKNKPDIILLDLLLPKKHGLEVLKEIKADTEFKDIPIIVLSNLDTDEDIKTAIKLGAVDYFVKVQHPINEIVEKVKARAVNVA